MLAVKEWMFVLVLAITIIIMGAISAFVIIGAIISAVVWG